MTGHAVVCKQQFQYQVVSERGGGVSVTPEFWLTQLWRKLMGTRVLDVVGDRSGSLRVYAHGQQSGSGPVAVLVINLARTPADVTISGTSATSHAQ